MNRSRHCGSSFKVCSARWEGKVTQRLEALPSYKAAATPNRKLVKVHAAASQPAALIAPRLHTVATTSTFLVAETCWCNHQFFLTHAPCI